MARPSTIDQLPEPVRAALNGWLRDPGITQTETAERANAFIDAFNEARPGEEPVAHVSRHAVNRYDQRMRIVGKRLRESRQMAEMWIGELGSQPQGQLGNLVNEMLRTLSYDLTLQITEDSTFVTPEERPAMVKMLKELAISAHRLEQAAEVNTKRDAEIRKQAQLEAAERVSEAARERGLGAEDAAFWRDQVLKGM